MKTVVVYYSLEGGTKRYAEIMAKELGADLISLIPEKEVPKSSFRKYLWGGKSVIFKERPKLMNGTLDVSKYDLILLGTPIWAGTFTAPMNTFIHDTKIHGKKVALFACHAGGGVGKCFSSIKEQLAGNIFIGEVDFLNPGDKGTDENDKKAAEFASNLQKLV